MYNLEILLTDIEEEFSLSVDLLRPYMDIFEVRNFVERREADLNEFKKLTRNCRASESIISIISYLRDMKAPSKIYGGICKRGADYFKIPKKILDQIWYREALEVVVVAELNYDKDYCIPDELSSEEFAMIYG